MLTLQEIVDISTDGLVKQGRPSYQPRGDNRNIRCCYRDPNGNKCAIGMCVPDDKYNPRWDIASTTASEVLLRDLHLITPKDRQPVNTLQSLHDRWAERHSECDTDKGKEIVLKDWQVSVREFCKNHNLTIPCSISPQ